MTTDSRWSARCASRSSWARERAHLVAAIGRVADLQRANRADELLLELVGDVLDDDESLGGDAALPVVLVARPAGDGRRERDVGVVEHHKGVGAAELEDRLLQDLARGLGNLGASGLGTCEGYARDAAVADDAVDHARAD